MVSVKTSAEHTSRIATAQASATAKGIVETAAVLLVGTRTSTNSPFMRQFPNQAALTNWLTTGDAADIEVVRVESITKFTG